MTNEESFSASRRNVLRGGAVAGGLMLGAIKPGAKTKGKVELGGLHVTKPVDQSSPNLFLACTTGKHIPTATLSMRASNAAADYLTVTMSEVLISGYSQSAAGNARPTESFTLNYTKIASTYT